MKLCIITLLILFTSCSLINHHWEETPNNYRSIGQSIIHDSLYMDQIESSKKILKAGMAKQNLPSISFSIGINGKMIWSEAIGFKNIKFGIPVNINSKYRIGSISKSVTSLALGKLFEEKN